MISIDFGKVEIPKSIMVNTVNQPLQHNAPLESPVFESQTLGTISDIPSFSDQSVDIYWDISASCIEPYIQDFQKNVIQMLKNKGAKIHVYKHESGLVGYKNHQEDILKAIHKRDAQNIVLMTDGDLDALVYGDPEKRKQGSLYGSDYFRVTKTLCPGYVFLIFFHEKSNSAIQNIIGKKGTSVEFIP